ncbi:PIN-like domain-containing protein [Lactiplantibacillus plantarum]|uniref:PIN-like domain-containing protein n=1 Tax=Lactiplantibacillus plantarum TaxID=1590 RepID=UPI0007B55911|nr:PIN-like domain-containing protein [Lactiplantibacillus plantarum]
MKEKGNIFKIGMVNRDIKGEVFSTNKTLLVLDTNFLIELVQQSEENAKVILERLNKISATIYIPFFALWEYAANNNQVLDVKVETRTREEDVEKNFKGIENEFRKTVKNAITPKGDDLYFKESIKTDTKEFIDKNMVKFNELKKGVLDKKKAVEEQLTRTASEISKVNNILLEFMDKHISNSLTIDQKWIDRYEKEGKKRYENKIGPGFADAGKEMVRQYGNLSYHTKYGDFFIWREVLDYTKSKPNFFETLVFVTNDQKDLYDSTKKYPDKHLFGELREANGKPTQLYICKIEEVLGLLDLTPNYIPVSDYDDNIEDKSMRKKLNENIADQIENNEEFKLHLGQWLLNKAPDSEDLSEGEGFKTDVEEVTIDTSEVSVSDLSLEEITFTTSLSGQVIISYVGENPSYERNIHDGIPEEIGESITFSFFVDYDGAYDLSDCRFEGFEFNGSLEESNSI